jgi:hypothetical protein
MYDKPALSFPKDRRKNLRRRASKDIVWDRHEQAMILITTMIGSYRSHSILASERIFAPFSRAVRAKH